MKKTIIASVVLAGVASSAFGADAALYMTAREYSAVGVGNNFRTNGTGGVPAASNTDIGTGTTIGTPILPANNPTLYLQPQLPGNRHLLGTPAEDTSSRGFQIWMNVAPKYTGANSEQLVSSVGIDVTKTIVAAPSNPGTPNIAASALPAANRQGTAAMTLTLYTTVALTNAAGTQLWDGVNIVTPPVTDARMVSVPDAVADFANGAVPAAGVPLNGAGTVASTSYRLGTVTIQANGPSGAANSGCRTQLPTRHELKLNNGNVLTTRAVNPAFAGALTPESIAYGYAGGVPEPASANGSTLPSTSATADGVVEVRFKGDFTGAIANTAPNGVVNSIDLTPFFQAVAAGANAGSLQRWLGDFSGALATQPPNGILNSIDATQMNAQITYFGTLALCP